MASSSSSSPLLESTGANGSSKTNGVHQSASPAAHSSSVAAANPGLAPFELSGYTGLADQNFYQLAPVLARLIRKYLPAEEIKAVEDHLNSFGALCGGEVNRLVFEAHRPEKLGHVSHYDRVGNRTEEIVYSPEQELAKELIFKAGSINLDLHADWNQPFHRLHQNINSYLISLNGEAGIVCPLGCNQGLINVLEQIGTDAQKEKWLSFLKDPSSTAYFTAGQFMTERVGGSNIGANRTVAKKGDNGKWYLTGEKWFCSNPGDVWVTTAKIEGTDHIGMFLVPRHKDNGELNDFYILRKKEIIGWKGKLTVEMEYRGVEAEIIGRPHLGLMNIMKYVITISRLGMSILSAAISRRAYLEAYSYARARMAYGKSIIQYQAVHRSLVTMQVMTLGSELTAFHSGILYDNNNPAYHFTMPLLKAMSSMVSSYVTHEAIILFGGNGIIDDFSVLPRMHNDSFIQEIGEGTHNIIAGHSLKAFFKPKQGGAFLKMIREKLAAAADDDAKARSVQAFKAAIDYCKAELSQIEAVEKTDLADGNQLPFLRKIYDVYVLALLLEEASADLAAGAGDPHAGYIGVLSGYLDVCKYGVDGFMPKQSVLMDDKAGTPLLAL